jgi:hypothetical protein
MTLPVVPNGAAAAARVSVDALTTRLTVARLPVPPRGPPGKVVAPAVDF